MERTRLTRSSFRRSGSGGGGSGGGGSDCCPDWPDISSGIGRYFFLSPNGNDGNVGFVDAALGSTFAISPTLVAKRTFAAFREILPPSGNNRAAILLIEPGVYAETFDWRGISGYPILLRRGSDLTNSTSDRVTCGFEIALAGPGPSQEFTVDAGPTTSSIPVVGGGLTAEPGILGYRVRFLTGALAGSVAIINANTANAITPEQNVGAGIAQGDTFVIERPGVECSGFIDMDGSPAITFSATVVATNCPAVGIRINSTAMRTFVYGVPAGPSRGVVYCGIEQTGVTGTTATVNAPRGGSLVIRNAYTDETAVSRTVGMTARFEDTFDASVADDLSISSVYAVGSFGGTGKFNRFGGGGMTVCSTSGYFRQGYIADHINVAAILPGGPGSLNALNAPRRVIGPSSITSNRPVRIPAANSNASQAAGVAINSHIQLRNHDITGMGALPGVKLWGNGLNVRLDAMTGTTGNTGVGIDLQNAVKCEVEIGTGNTLAGTGGEIQLPGPALQTYAALALTNVEDSAGNNVQGSAGKVVGPCKFVSNQSGGALAVGDLVRSNGTGNQVTSSQADTAANCPNIGVMVTPPASGAGGYMAGPGGTPVIDFDGAPTVGAIAYVSPGTARKATTTVPAVAATNQKLRIGRPIQQVSGTLFRTAFSPEWLPVLADGNP